MSNGDSLDGFVFPPFIPTASTRPAEAPAPPAPEAYEAPAQEAPPAEPAEAAGSGRMTMPWDLETPIVRDDDAAPQQASAPAGDDDEDLPWLEVPTPREDDAPAAEADAPAAPRGEAFPEWMAWDERDEREAESEMRDTVAPLSGLEDFVPMDDLGGYLATPAAAQWAEADPEEASPTAEPGVDAPFGAEPPPVFQATPEPDAFADTALDDLLGLDEEPAGSQADGWSLDAAEAIEPPALFDTLPGLEFDAVSEASAGTEAAAEPSFEISLADEADDGFTVEAAAPAADPQPFVADEEAVLAAEPEPVVEPEQAEPDPFTAAAVAEAEFTAAPADADAAESPFDDVAARLETIARALRERPDELLAGGSSDPLALLVTGYVMGYTARGGR